MTAAVPVHGEPVTDEAPKAEQGLRSALPEAYSQGMRQLGQGRLTWFGLHIYDASLYVRPGRFEPTQLAAGEFVLVLKYARRLNGQQIAERSVAEMAKQNCGTADEHTRWLAAMTQAFPDVKASDTLAGVVMRDGSTRFYFNGKRSGAVEGERFADCFFGIWLKPETTQPKLRAALLKGLQRPQGEQQPDAGNVLRPS